MKKKTLLVSLVAALIVSSAIIPVSAATASAPVSVSNAEAANGAAVSGDVKLDETNFPDPVFREYLKTNYDKDKNNSLSQDEISSIHEIKLGNSGVTNLKGIEFLTEITYLEVMETGITELDVSKNTKLTLIDCSNTKISSLDLSQNTALRTLWCYDSPITELNLTKNAALDVLRAGGTAITELDLSQNPQLRFFEVNNTGITSLLLGNNPNLEWFNIANTQISNIDLSKQINLKVLYCGNTNISDLNLINNKLLEHLYCENTKIKDLNISENSHLKTLFAPNTKLADLNTNNNTNLIILEISNTDISKLNTSHLQSLQLLNISGTNIESLNVSNNTNLKYLKYDNAPLVDLNVGVNPQLQITSSSAQSHKLEVEGGSFSLTQFFPTLDINKIVNVTGATVVDGNLSNYLPGQPITYTYDTGTGVNGQPIYLTVTLNLMITNVWEQDISASDMVLGEKVNVSAKPVFGDVQYVYSQQEDGVYTADEPTAAGLWYVKAIVSGSEFLTALESQPVAFNVKQLAGAPENPNHNSKNDSGNQDMVNNVKTGDETTVGLLASVFAVSVGVLASLKVLKKKKKSDKI